MEHVEVLMTIRDNHERLGKKHGYISLYDTKDLDERITLELK